MRTRLIERVGTRYELRKEWGTCPNPASEFSGRHEGRTSFDTDHVPPPSKRYTDMPDQDDPHYSEITACDQCGEEAPDDASHLAGTAPIYDTPHREAAPGSLYFVTHDPDEWCWLGWENCDGEHLHCVLPNGQHWVVDSRASNCTRTEDKTHRCWVRRGDPRAGELVHVDKNGDTCQAGAGSIMIGDYHGFLHNGHLTSA